MDDVRVKTGEHAREHSRRIERLVSCASENDAISRYTPFPTYLVLARCPGRIPILRKRATTDYSLKNMSAYIYYQ
jgi:hypothetical protein